MLKVTPHTSTSQTHNKSSQHHNTLHISYFYRTFSYILKLKINRNKLLMLKVTHTLQQ